MNLSLLPGIPAEDPRVLIQRYLDGLAEVPNLLFEWVNEPEARDKVDVTRLIGLSAARPWTNGGAGVKAESGLRFVPSAGTWLTWHTRRDFDWPRSGHDLMELYNGGGPNDPTDPPHHLPCVADENIRPDQAKDLQHGDEDQTARDYLAHAAVCSILGAGATFHFDSGKFGRLPTDFEARCAEAFSAGLRAFPAGAPLGPYARLDEGPATLRTYKAGPYTVRVRPTDGVVLP